MFNKGGTSFGLQIIIYMIKSYFKPAGLHNFAYVSLITQERLLLSLHYITVQPNTDIFSYLAKDFRENKNLTCRKCTIQSS